MKKVCIICGFAVSMMASAQNYIHFTTTEGNEWQESKASLSGKAAAEPVLTITGTEQGHEFKAWGTCFNELDLDALELLQPGEQEEVMRRLFDPDGDLKDHVLGKFSKEDLATMRKTMERAVEAIPLILNGDIDGAMSQYNG